jgi:hypothetical protein
MEYYLLKTNQHLFNECLYVSKGRDYVVQHVVVGIVVDTFSNSLKDSNASSKWKQRKKELGYVP